jgi:hypothetical protein
MPMPCPQPWPLKTSALDATLSASDGAAVVVVVAAAVVVTTVVVAALVVVAGRVVVVAATLVEAGSGGGGVATVAGGVALGPVAIGSEGAGSATTFAEAIPANPSSASVVSSRARRSTDAR